MENRISSLPVGKGQISNKNVKHKGKNSAPMKAVRHEAISLIQSGKSVREAAAELNIAISTIYSWLQQSKVSKTAKPKRSAIADEIALAPKQLKLRADDSHQVFTDRTPQAKIVLKSGISIELTSSAVDFTFLSFLNELR